MRPSVNTIGRICNAVRIVVTWMILRAIRLIAFSCIAFLATNAMALTEKQIELVTNSALELCRGGKLEGEATTYRIEGGAEAKLVIIKALAEAGLKGKVELTGSDWKGIEAVIPKHWDAAEYNKCVIPIVTLFIEKLEGGGVSPKEDDVDAAVRAMEWFKSRCGPGIGLIVPYAVGSTSDRTARSFFLALKESGVKPIQIPINMPRIFIENGRFSVQKLDEWHRANPRIGWRDGCWLAIVPEDVQQSFDRPRFNVSLGKQAYSIVLPVGASNDATDRWNVIFKKASNCTVSVTVVPSRGVHPNRGGARWVAAWNRDSNAMPRRWWRRWVTRTARPRRAGICAD